MVDNIVINYVVNSDGLLQARRDLGLLGSEEKDIRAEMERVNREARQQVTEFKRVGDTAKEVKKVEKEEKDLAAAANKVNNELEEQNRELKKSGTEGAGHIKNTNREMGMLGNVANNVAGYIAAAFAIDQLLRFAGNVITTTAEFQKLQKVLEVGLGSESAAQMAFAKIQQYAATTPYAVSEVTNAYVKLVNRGIEPTTKELTSLGDLSASVGKSIDQVTESLLDAMTGEFERLKEVGVRAKSVGDNVQFTFKGVTTEVAKTDEAIKAYIFSLGELNGVAGSTAGIAETLGGKISNMDDAFDRLFFTIGNGTDGPLVWFIEKITEATGLFADFFRSQEQELQDDKNNAMVRYLEGWDYKGIDDYRTHLAMLNEEYNKMQTAQDQVWKEYNKAAQELTIVDGILGNLTNGLLGNEKQVDKLAGTYNAFNTELAAIAESIKMVKENRDKFIAGGGGIIPVEQLGILEKLRLELKKVQELREKAVTGKEIAAHNRRMEQIKEEIEKWEKLGLAKEKTAKIDPFKPTGPTSPFTDNTGKTGKTRVDLDKANATEMDALNGITQSQRDADLFADQLYSDAVIENARTRAEKILEIEKDKNEKMQEYGEALFHASMDLINTLFEAQAIKLEERAAQLQSDHENELNLAGNTAGAKEKIDREYADKHAAVKKEQMELARKQAIFNKAVAVGEIAVNTAMAVTSILSTGGGTRYADFGISAGILTAMVVALGAVQAATVLAQPIPKFAKGTKSVQGGTPGMDSVLAWLMPKERVITVGTSREYGTTLDAVQDRRIPAHALNEFTERYLKFGDMMLRPAAMLPHPMAGGADNGNALLDAIAERPVQQTIFDENGVTEFVHHKGTRTQSLNKRYE